MNKIERFTWRGRSGNRYRVWRNGPGFSSYVDVAGSQGWEDTCSDVAVSDRILVLEKRVASLKKQLARQKKVAEDLRNLVESLR